MRPSKMRWVSYVQANGHNCEKATVKQHLAPIRMLFDWLVNGRIVATDPTHAAKPDLVPDDARKLLDSIDVSIAVRSPNRAVIAYGLKFLPPQRPARDAGRGRF
jgi:integrase/recombinase XerD